MGARFFEVGAPQRRLKLSSLPKGNAAVAANGRKVPTPFIQPAINQRPLQQKESKVTAPGNPLRAAEG